MDFVNKRIWFFSLSLILISIGVIFLIISPGLKPGIDFTGGSTLSIKFNNDTTQEDLRSELSQIGHPILSYK